MKRAPSLGCLIAGLLGCGAGLGPMPSAFEPLRTAPDVAVLTHGVRGPRLVPESPILERSYGVEPGGGIRGIAAGVRIVSFASGAILSATDRLTQTPTAIAVLPDRLGGGVLFAIGDNLWRADRWLSRAQPIFRAPTTISGLWIGLDRVYARLPSNAVIALDPVSGTPLDLGALPASPSVIGFAALDGFRAVALADLRGVVTTTDAGATWRSLPIPIEPKTLTINSGESVIVSSGGSEAYEVRPEGDFGKITARTGSGEHARDATVGKGAPLPVSDFAKTFGARPLALAVTDGIPLSDGTVLVARDGAIARIRLADGAIVDTARDAYPLRPSHCHGIAIGEINGVPGAGFVCAEPQGRTHVYRYAPERRGLELALAFENPRIVLPAANGAVAVRGRCAEDAANATPVPGVPSSEVAYCVRDAYGVVREQILTANVDNARVVALKDGTLAVIVPPRNELGNGHLTLAGRSGAKTVAITFDGDNEAARRAIAQGMWLDGFEERQPGVLSGWIEHAGTMLGVEVDLGGRARHGAYVRDAGTVMVSGRFGLGWTASQRGFETTDGGTTWRAIELPEPIAPKNAGGVRGCNAVGCVLEGWIRVGWGEVPPAPPPAPNSIAVSRLQATNPLELTCDYVARGDVRNSGPFTIVMGGVSARSYQPRPSAEMHAFYGAAPPAINPEEVGTEYPITSFAGVAHQPLGLIGQIYVWGSRGLEWDATSRTLVRWTSPFTTSANVFSSASTKSPPALVEATRYVSGAGTNTRSVMPVIANADDPRHALLILTRQAMSTNPIEGIVVVLDDGRAPLEVKRADGEPFGAILGAVRHEGRWFVLADQPNAEPDAVVLWEIEGSAAREVLRAPRVVEAAKASPRLARREGMLGIVVDGQPQADRAAQTRWVLAIDVANGRTAELEPVGLADFASRTISACTGDEGGWEFDLPLTSLPLRLNVRGKTITPRPGAYGRVRISKDKLCVDRIAATLDAPIEELGLPGRAALGRNVEVGLVTSGGGRQELRCSKLEKK
jgi:hypothetical protein